MSSEEFLSEYGWWKPIYYNPAKRIRAWDGTYTSKGTKQNRTYVYCECFFCHEEDWISWNNILYNTTKDRCFVGKGHYVCKDCVDRDTIYKNGNLSKLTSEERSEIVRRARRSYSPEKNKEIASKRLKTIGEERLKEMGRKRFRDHGSPFTEEVLKRAADTRKKIMLENGYTWAQQSIWERDVLIPKYNCHPDVFYSPLHKSTIYPDLVWDDGHVVQIDDSLHRAVKGLTKNNWDTGEKHPLYEYMYDQACLQHYGHRPLHIMLPHIDVVLREGFKDAYELIEAYLRDELDDSLLIMVSDPWYGDIEYPGLT